MKEHPDKCVKKEALENDMLDGIDIVSYNFFKKSKWMKKEQYN